jgi:hypothetical protein
LWNKFREEKLGRKNLKEEFLGKICEKYTKIDVVSILWVFYEGHFKYLLEAVKIDFVSIF